MAKKAAAKKSPIGVGIVGLGRAGWGMHANEIKRQRGKFKVVAGCDPLPEFRQRLSDAFKCNTYETIEEMIKDENVDLVSIASRSTEHYKHCIMALKAGKHVVLDKPICLSYAEAKKIKAAAARAKGKLFIRHNRRFDADFVHVKEIIDSGILGKVFEIKLSRINYQRRDDWQTLIDCGGGQLLNWGPHIIDHALQFLGGSATKIWGDLKKVAAVGDAEDHLKIILQGKGELLVDIEISGGGALPAPTYDIRGDRGALIVDEKGIHLRYIDPKCKLMNKKAKSGTPMAGYGGTPEKIKWIEKTLKIRPKEKKNIWDETYKALRCGGKYPITLDQSVEVMRVVSEVKKGTPFAAAKKAAKKTGKKCARRK